MRSLVVPAALLLVACKSDRPAPQPTPPAGQPSSTAGAAAAAPSAPIERRREPVAPPPEPAHVFLPRSPNTPPHRTTRPLAAKELERLSEIDHKDFKRDVRVLNERGLEVRHATTTRPILSVTVAIGPCGPSEPAKQPAAKPAAGKPPAAPKARPCRAMDLAAWQADGDLRRRSITEQLVDRPDTQFELGSRELDGAPAIYTYQLGHFFGTDERGQPAGAFTDAYVLYYNDGVNQLRVHAAYTDDAVASKAALAALAPKDDLETLAVAFARYYLHAWK